MALSTENPVFGTNVIRQILTLLAILRLEIAKNLFAAGSAEQISSPLVYNRLTVLHDFYVQNHKIL